MNANSPPPKTDADIGQDQRAQGAHALRHLHADGGDAQAMTRRCGNCLFAQEINNESVACYGGPPHVTGVVDGKVSSQAPLLPKTMRACAEHAYRFGPRALFWKLTGGP